MSQLIIFDWDHTLAVPESGETFRKAGEKYKWASEDMPKLLEFLYTHEECELAVATNQGGIAYNIVRKDETEHAIFALLRELEFHVPFLVSPFHENRPQSFPEYYRWRKPDTGMLKLLDSLYPDIESVLVVGDRDEDEGAALACEFAFERAEEFFQRTRKDMYHFESNEINAGENFDDDTGRPDDPNEIPF